MPLPASFRLFIATILLFSGLNSEAGTVGIFQGLVVQGSSGAGGTYIYVQGKNGNVRRVKITGARVSYASSVPLSQRVKNPVECLREHPEVKVTAEQAANGEWKAQEIVIVRLSQRKVAVVLRSA
jgi:hypothetical protein